MPTHDSSNRPLRLLMLEDSTTDAELMLQRLGRGGFAPQSLRVETREAFEEAVRQPGWEIILADYRLLRYTAFDALQAWRASGTEAPFILVSGTIAEEDAVALLEAGVYDFVSKDGLVRLVPAIERALRETAERRTRRQTEEALRRSEERYRDLVENANDVVLMVDLAGNFTSLNTAGEQISGYTREEVVQMNMSDVLTPESFQRAVQMIQQKLADNRPTVYELTMIARDGHQIPLEVSTRLIYHDSVPVAVQGIARDITERKRSAEALAESEERYRGLFENASDIVYTHDLTGKFTSINKAAEGVTGYARDEVLTMSIDQIVAPDHIDLARTMIRRKLATADQTTYELDILTKGGTRSTIEVNSQLIYGRGEPVGVQGIARDVTERRRAEEELRARERKQAAVALLGQHALVSTDLSALLGDTVGSVAETLGVPFCTVLEATSDGKELVARAGVGWKRDLIGRGAVRSGLQSLAGFTLYSSEPVVVEDLVTETRFSIPEILKVHEVKSGMSVIIGGGQRPFGVLTALSGIPRQFSRDDVHFLQAVANVIAAAIDRKRLEEERARHSHELATRVLQAQEEERKRIARELHDDTAQSLSMLLMNLELLEPSVPAEDRAFATGFRRVAGLARRTLDAVRALSHDLRPTILDDAGLEAALEWVAHEYEREFRGAAFVETDIPARVTLTPELEVVLFRIAQEALTNCGKHADASTVWIRLHVRDGAAHLVVEDNGVGFDLPSVPRPTRQGRLGLYGMNERAALFGGTLTIETSPGQGTRVTATLPIPPAAGSDMIETVPRKGERVLP